MKDADRVTPLIFAAHAKALAAAICLLRDDTEDNQLGLKVMEAVRLLAAACQMAVSDRTAQKPTRSLAASDKPRRKNRVKQPVANPNGESVVTDAPPPGEDRWSESQR